MRLYKNSWEPVCLHDEISSFNDCSSCDNLIRDPTALIQLFIKRNKKREKFRKSERVYKLSDDHSTVLRLYKNSWEPVCLHDELTSFNNCKSCHPVPVKFGCSQIACKFFDRLEIELGFPIQHAHFNFQTGLVEGDEFRVNNLKIDGFYRNHDGVNIAIEFLGDIWHGHPSIWGTNFDRFHGSRKLPKGDPQLDFYNTEKRFNVLVQYGFRVFYIWQSTFQSISNNQLIFPLCSLFNGVLLPIPSHPPAIPFLTAQQDIPNPEQVDKEKQELDLDPDPILEPEPEPEPIQELQELEPIIQQLQELDESDDSDKQETDEKYLGDRCPKCDKYFVHLDNHLRSTKKKGCIGQSFICLRCCQSFDHLSILHRHQANKRICIPIPVSGAMSNDLLRYKKAIFDCGDVSNYLQRAIKRSGKEEIINILLVCPPEDLLIFFNIVSINPNPVLLAIMSDFANSNPLIYSHIRSFVNNFISFL